MQKKKKIFTALYLCKLYKHTNTQTHHLGGGGENAFFKEFKV